MTTPTIVYIYPSTAGPQHTALALRFIETYNVYPPGIDHRTIVVLNGGKPTTEIKLMFASVRNVTLLEHDDSGWDIGGYQLASLRFPAEMMVFFGGSTHFLRQGWLLRMASVFNQYGPGLYGATANRGDPGVRVEPHIRTTAFWVPSKFMNEYPMRVIRNDQRYPFEHGKGCFTSWIIKKGLKPWLVTWRGVYAWADWDVGQDGFYGVHRINRICPNVANLLVGDRLTGT